MGKFTNLTAGTLGRRRTLEDEDPLSGLSNLADCMLVLACGLMVALVVAWNIDIQDVTEVEMTEKRTEIDDVSNMQGDFEAGGTTYVDIGRVYQDPETGTYFVLENEKEEAGGEGE